MTVTPNPDLADAPVLAQGRLIGGRCGTCGAAWFPYKTVCPACAAPEASRTPLAPAGTLYSWSTVHVSSARPVPYTLGYVDNACSGGATPSVRVVGSPLRLDGPPAGDHTYPPPLGADTDQVLRGDLSLSDDEIARLRAEKAVS